MPDAMDQLIELYKAYLQQIQEAEKRLKPADGLFGMGEKLANAPCHEAFLEALRAFFDSMDTREDPERICQVLSYVYQAPFAYPQVHRSAYWMFLAVQGLTQQAIPCLRPEDAQALYLWYQKAYPRRERLPVQNQVLEALKRRGKQA